MWANILKEKGLRVGYFQFLKTGATVMFPVALCSLLALELSLG